MIENINKRIQQVINQYYNGNVSKYCRDVDVRQTTMNEIIGKSQIKPSASTLAKLATSKMVRVSIDWLLTGEGEMIKNNAIVAPTSHDMDEQRIRMELYQRRIDELTRENRELIKESAVLRYRLDERNSG